MIFPQEQTISYHSTSVIRPVKRNKLSFPSIEDTKPIPAHSPQCLVDEIQHLQPSLVVATDQMTRDTESRELYH